MAISTGSSITATDFNNLKARVYAEASRRSLSYTIYTDVSAGEKITATVANSLISPLNTINASLTNFSTVSQNGKIYPLAFGSALVTFENTPKTATNSNCSSGCTGLCQSACTGGCRSTCTANCANDCTGSCTGTCSTTCTGTCSTTCTGSCSGTCSTTCTGSCSGGCSTSCSGGCRTGCYNTCQSSCSGDCSGGCSGCGNCDGWTCSQPDPCAGNCSSYFCSWTGS